MNVDDVVAEKIAAARARMEATARRRAAMKAARQRGLAHRHAAKLRNLATPRAGASTVAQKATVAEDVVTELTEAEFRTAVQAALARLGLTYAQLEDQARRRDFTSAQANSLWTLIGGAVRPALLDPKENN